MGKKIYNGETVSFTIRIPKPMWKKLSDRAQKRGVFLNYEATETLAAGLEKRENLREKMTEKHVLP